MLQAVPQEMTDCIDISEVQPDDIVEKIRKYFDSDSSKICQFCKGRPKSVTDIPYAEQSNEKLYYKKYTYDK